MQRGPRARPKPGLHKKKGPHRREARGTSPSTTKFKAASPRVAIGGQTVNSALRGPLLFRERSIETRNILGFLGLFLWLKVKSPKDKLEAF